MTDTSITVAMDALVPALESATLLDLVSKRCRERPPPLAGELLVGRAASGGEENRADHERRERVQCSGGPVVLEAHALEDVRQQAEGVGDELVRFGRGGHVWGESEMREPCPPRGDAAGDQNLCGLGVERHRHELQQLRRGLVPDQCDCRVDDVRPGGIVVIDRRGRDLERRGEAANAGLITSGIELPKGLRRDLGGGEVGVALGCEPGHP